MLRNILTITIIIIAILAFAFYVRPTYSNIQTLRLKQTEYELALENARRLQSIREDLIDKRNSFSNSDLERLDKLLPDNVDNVKLILELQTVAQENGLELQTASAVESEETGPSNIDIETKDYGIISLNFELSGGYSDFVNFLQEIAQTLRLTDIESISFKRKTEKNEGQEEKISYTFNLKLKTYWLKDNI